MIDHAPVVIPAPPTPRTRSPLPIGQVEKVAQRGVVTVLSLGGFFT